MRVRLYGRSDVGRRRSSNEDSFVLCEDEGLGVVCDGMGGHEAGEVASRMAVDLFADRVTRAWPKLMRGDRKLSRLRALASDLIRACAEEANAAIHGQGSGKGDSHRSQMGTTLAAVFVVRDFAVVANVGDSRIYRMRDGILEQLSEDHTIVAKAKRKHAADPRPTRKRKYVTRALGTRAEVDPTIRMVNTFPGDLFVLCSDGLTDVVGDDEIGAIVRKGRNDMRKVLRSLIDLANQRGGPDNVTIVAAEVIGDAEDDEDTEELNLPKPV